MLPQPAQHNSCNYEKGLLPPPLTIYYSFGGNSDLVFSFNRFDFMHVEGEYSMFMFEH